MSRGGDREERNKGRRERELSNESQALASFTMRLPVCDLWAHIWEREHVFVRQQRACVCVCVFKCNVRNRVSIPST